MRLMSRKPVLASVVLLVLAVVLAVAAGCGGSSSSGSTPTASAAANTNMSAAQIVSQSQTKMAAVKSASFNADLALAIQGDTSKITDPTAKALLSQGITLHVEGKSGDDPQAVDIRMTAGLAGQNIDLSLLGTSKKSWVGYQGKWYVADAKTQKSLNDQAAKGTSPDAQLKSLGLDPSAWGTSYELVGTEDLNGTQVYHVKATADPQKVADALLKAANDPSLAKKLGTEGQQLEQGLAQSKAQAEELKNALKNVAVDYYVGVDDMLMHKGTLDVTLDTSAMKDMQGVTGMTIKGSVTMADFNQPVSVKAPANALPIKKLMNEMLGGMMGGTSL